MNLSMTAVSSAWAEQSNGKVMAMVKRSRTLTVDLIGILLTVTIREQSADKQGRRTPKSATLRVEIDYADYRATADSAEMVGARKHDAIDFRTIVAFLLVDRSLKGADLTGIFFFGKQRPFVLEL